MIWHSHGFLSVFSFFHQITESVKEMLIGLKIIQTRKDTMKKNTTISSAGKKIFLALTKENLYK